MEQGNRGGTNNCVAFGHHLIVGTQIMNNVDAEFDANRAKNVANMNNSFYT